MKQLGPKEVKPPTVARFGGMRILRVDQSGITTTKQNIIYLRHASALSAAVAKNISSTMNQPDDLAPGSDSVGEESFLDAHSRYSFITVLTLMSLFMVVTISATGFMLAFYRKKNAVFAASSKSDADSQLELDDFDNADVETCRGDKGECYVHLSEESDDDVHEQHCDNRELAGGNIADPRTRRSMTFPQLHEVLKRRKSTQTSSSSKERTAKDRPITNAMTPLIHSMKPQFYHQHQCNHTQEINKLSYQNLNHQHEHDQRPLTHKQCPRCFNCQVKSSSTLRFHHGPCQKHHLPGNGMGKLRRSHTIHAIPQTDTRHQSRLPLRAGYNLKIREYNKTTQAKHKIDKSAKTEQHAASKASHGSTHRVSIDTHFQAASGSHLQLNHTVHQEDPAQCSHRKNTNSAKDQQYPASDASHSSNYRVGVVVVHPYTPSSSHLQLHHNNHQKDDSQVSHRKMTSSAKRQPHAASAASHSSNHGVAIVPHYATSSHHLKLHHHIYHEYDACKNNPKWNQEDSSAHKMDYSSSYNVGLHKPQVDGALTDNEHDFTLENTPSLPQTTKTVHPSSPTTTHFCPCMLATSIPHSTTVSPQENCAVIFSTAAAHAKFSNSQSHLRDNQTNQATEARTDPLSSLDNPDLSSQPIAHTGRSTASTSDRVNPLSPPHKPSSKRQQKQTKERDKKSYI